MSYFSEKLTKYIFGDNTYLFAYAPEYHPIWSDQNNRRKLNNVKDLTRDSTSRLDTRKLLCTECKKIKLDYVVPICENCSNDDSMISFRLHGSSRYFQIQKVQRIPVYKDLELYSIWSVIYSKKKRPKNFKIIKYFTIG